MKKDECIVHIGMHKTGSSSIQQSLHDNLDHPTISYLDLVASNHGGKIFSVFAKGKVGYAHKKRNLTTEEILILNHKTRELLIKTIIADPKPIQIISGENITGLSQNDLEDFKVFLLNFFKKIRIVGYVRTPKSFMESAFQQMVKGSMKRFNIEQCYPHYRERFEKFDIVFGNENVELWKFDINNFPISNVVLDFSQHLKLNMKEEETIRVNESISKEALSLLYIYRKYGPGFGLGEKVIKENKNLIKALSSIGTTKIKFAYSLVKPFLEKNSEDILWMENRLNMSLDENILAVTDEIKSEDDLLNINIDIIKEFSVLSGEEYIFSKDNSYDLKEIALLIHSLRIKLSERKASNKIEKINLIELAEEIKNLNISKLEKINTKEMTIIIREALVKINNQLSKNKEINLKVPYLGMFQVKRVKEHTDKKLANKNNFIFKASKLERK